MIDYLSLNRKGYLVIPNILSVEDLEQMRNDYAAIKHKFEFENPENKNYKLLPGKIQDTVYQKLNVQLRNVSVFSNLKIDTFFSKAITYFDSEFLNFNWHIDHEMYYMYQHPNRILNFWVPLIKPEPTTSGLTILPHDVFKRLSPDIFEERILNHGAKRFRVREGKTILYDDEIGDTVTIDFDFNEYSVTPSVMPGDLLILKGDVVHRSQEESVNRVAFSIRAIDEDVVITKEKFNSGCQYKKQMIENNVMCYSRFDDAYSKSDSLKIKDLLKSGTAK